MADGLQSATAGFDEAADVTHSTAFAVLNTLIEEGHINEERADYLKQKFKDLHTRVLTVYKRDNLLLKRARRLRADLDTERAKLQARGEVARKDDEEIRRLKRDLLEREKELTELQERESILQVEALEYDRRKHSLILEREDAMAAEEARIRPKIDALRAELVVMGNEVKELAGKHEMLYAKKVQLSKAEAECRAEIATFPATLAQAKQQCVNVDCDLDRVKKQLQLVTRSVLSAQKEMANVEERLNTQAEQISKLELQRNNRANEQAAAKANQQSIQKEIEAKRKTLATLSTSLEVEMETKQGYHERLTELEQLMKAAKVSKVQEADSVDRVLHEKERCVREFIALEKAKGDLTFAFNALQEQAGLVDKEAQNAERHRREVQGQIEVAKKELEVHAKRLLKEQAKEKDFVAKANVLVEELNDAEDLLHQKSKQDEVKAQELAAITAQREVAIRDCGRELSRAALIKGELQAKTTYVREARHRKSELEKRLAALIELFQKVKRERSHRATQIQAIAQKMTEVAEKTKILENELDVLKRESDLKSKELVKKKRQVHAATQSCAHLRLERGEHRKRLQVAMDEEKEIKAQVRRVAADVASVEDTMVSLRDVYLGAVESRNQTGIQLIDRNDELSLLCEKAKVQEAILQEGAAMTNARAVEVNALRIRLADLQRQIEVCQRAAPKIEQLEKELAKLSDEVDDERWRVSVLENDLTDPNNPHRWRKIGTVIGGASGKIPPVSTTKKKEATTGAAAEGGVQDVSKSSNAGGGGGDGVGATGTNGALVAASHGGSARGPPDGQRSTVDGSDSEDGDTTALLRQGGPSEEYVRLHARCQELEDRVHRIDAKLREKELILAEVTELADRIGEQAQSGQTFTLALAKQVNQYQGSMQNKTRQMMAAISELSLFQASSVQLQQEVDRLETVVAEAESRLEAGEAPFAEAVEEYEREKASSQRYAELLRRRKLTTDDSTSITAAMAATTGHPPPRANAYIPDDELGLPRPYGPYAPFKPTVTATRRAVAAASPGTELTSSMGPSRTGRFTPATARKPASVTPRAASTSPAASWDTPAARSSSAAAGGGAAAANGDAVSLYSSPVPVSVYSHHGGSRVGGDDGSAGSSGGLQQMRLSQRHGSPEALQRKFASTQ